MRVKETLEFFAYEHLKPELQVVSKPFHEVAVLVAMLPPSHEREKSLDRLLEAKDAAVRARMAHVE